MKTYYINAPLEQWASRIVAQNNDIITINAPLLKVYTEAKIKILT